MITQAIKTHTNALEVILEGRMQENGNSFYWTTSSSRFERPHCSQPQTLHVTCVTPLSYSATQSATTTVTSHAAPALQTEYCNLPEHPKVSSILQINIQLYELLHNLRSLEKFL